ncbi:hypothetical protein CO671_25870 [Rhizobium sp. M10]|uniref:hypothetical protein n=1 Tax=Rhizobium sp. M10 TaxID=1324586 RepID=UPI000BE9FC87|nr:hypothetical protein [Rhizobium sp. M10]PDT33235.1 hypothetical protein CO671_25870 [Rhizobium sp. M10]
MSKLNIYRSILIICLAAIVYIWSLAALIIAVWWMAALIGVWVKKIDPSHGESSIYQIINTDPWEHCQPGSVFGMGSTSGKTWTTTTIAETASDP